MVTDIKGSTKMWSGFERSMPELLRLHDVVLRENLIAFGGREILTEGDSFQLAFRDVSSAVAWCVKVQRDLLAQPWPDEMVGGAPECARIPVDADEVDGALRSAEFWRQLIAQHQHCAHVPPLPSVHSPRAVASPFSEHAAPTTLTRR